MVAASVAALTIYDMCKAVDKGIVDRERAAAREDRRQIRRLEAAPMSRSRARRHPVSIIVLSDRAHSGERPDAVHPGREGRAARQPARRRRRARAARRCGGAAGGADRAVRRARRGSCSPPAGPGSARATARRRRPPRCSTTRCPGSPRRCAPRRCARREPRCSRAPSPACATAR